MLLLSAVLGNRLGAPPVSHGRRTPSTKLPSTRASVTGRRAVGHRAMGGRSTSYWRSVLQSGRNPTPPRLLPQPGAGGGGSAETECQGARRKAQGKRQAGRSNSGRQILGNLRQGHAKSTSQPPSTANKGPRKHCRAAWAFLVASPAECDGNGRGAGLMHGSYLPNLNRTPPILRFTPPILRSRLLLRPGSSFCRAWRCARSAALLHAGVCAHASARSPVVPARHQWHPSHTLFHRKHRRLTLCAPDLAI